jgi:vesicle coat complex subunit
VEFSVQSLQHQRLPYPQSRIFDFACELEHSFCRWGQVFILDALSKYKSKDGRDAENIVDRVTPRLQHANCAVVLSAVKVARPSCLIDRKCEC